MSKSSWCLVALVGATLIAGTCVALRLLGAASTPAGEATAAQTAPPVDQSAEPEPDTALVAPEPAGGARELADVAPVQATEVVSGTSSTLQAYEQWKERWSDAQDLPRITWCGERNRTDGSVFEAKYAGYSHEK